MKRPETGVMQFTDDWPGIFIRGDNALGYAINLESVVACIEADDARPIRIGSLKALIRLLKSCNARENREAQQAALALQTHPRVPESTPEVTPEAIEKASPKGDL